MLMIFHVAPDIWKTNQNPLKIIDIQILSLGSRGSMSHQTALSIVIWNTSPLSLHTALTSHLLIFFGQTELNHNTRSEGSTSPTQNMPDSLSLIHHDPRCASENKNSWGMGNSESDGFFPPPSCTQVKASKVYTTRPRVKFHPSQTYWIAPHK